MNDNVGSPVISIVTPAHNEAENVPVLIEQVTKTIGDLVSIEFVIVDDGSTDDTADVLRNLASQDARVKYISFSRNFGHQAAINAGLHHASGAAAVVMDADLQHPPSLLTKMIASWKRGSKIVLTERRDDPSLSIFKRKSSAFFYRLLSFLSNIEMRPGSADFYLLDRDVIAALSKFSESGIFLRGLLPSIGFKTDRISFDPGARYAGVSSYNLSKMLRLGRTGLLSISLHPLRLGALLASIVAAFAGLYAIYVVLAALFNDAVVPGWASVTLVVSVIGALQLLVLGVIGEYLGQVLVETRRRPMYLIEKTNIRSDDQDRSERFIA